MKEFPPTIIVLVVASMSIAYAVPASPTFPSVMLGILSALLLAAAVLMTVMYLIDRAIKRDKELR